MTWDWAFAFEVWPALLAGLQMTLFATVSASALALVLGMVFALGRRSKSRAIRWTTMAIVEFVRRTPVLVQIYFIFFVLPEIGITLPGLTAGIFALGLHTGAYMSEVYRAGIESVPAGQWEAANALNYPPAQTWIRVILPQAVPPMIPALGNYILLMFKDTTLLSIIAVPELMSMARNIGNDTYRYLEPLTLVAVVYLVLNLICVRLIIMLERRYDLQRPLVRWRA
jgi:polar amino acid transport system permease protein